MKKIKKILALALSLVMVLSLFGCSKKDSAIDETNGTKENNETIGTKQEINLPYAEDQVLFYAQNKYRIEDDSHIIHFYNYKGELLSSNDTSRIKSFYIPSYNKFGLSPSLDFVTERYGFVDKNGEFVINPIYSSAYPFSNGGLALVSKEIDYNEKTWEYTFKYGYIDTVGKEVIPVQYDYATSFYDSGLAIVGMGKMYEDCKMGVIDNKGNYIIEAQYYDICDIEGDYILCYGNEPGIYHIYNLSGKLIYEYNTIENTKYGDYIYCLGKNIFIRHAEPSNDDERTIYIFNGNNFVEYDKTIVDKDTKIITTEESGRGYGLSYKGETVIPCEYQDIIYINGYYIAENSYLVESYDIYNENFEKTADGIEYDLTEYKLYSKYRALPKGYFYIIAEDERDGTDMYGIINYAGKIIVEPIFSDPIQANTYEFTGLFRRSNEG